MKFTELSLAIQSLHQMFVQQAGRFINQALTLRNWFIGFYIKEFEQRGLDRAEYGSRLLQQLSSKLQNAKIPSATLSSLKQYRQFYETYSQIGQTASCQLGLTRKSHASQEIPSLPPEKLTRLISYSHLVELMKIEDAVKRAFYEVECLTGQWSVRELKRQVNSLCYERLELSKNHQKFSDYLRSDPNHG